MLFSRTELFRDNLVAHEARHLHKSCSHRHRNHAHGHRVAGAVSQATSESETCANWWDSVHCASATSFLNQNTARDGCCIRREAGSSCRLSTSALEPTFSSPVYIPNDGPEPGRRFTWLIESYSNESFQGLLVAARPCPADRELPSVEGVRVLQRAESGCCGRNRGPRLSNRRLDEGGSNLVKLGFPGLEFSPRWSLYKPSRAAGLSRKRDLSRMYLRTVSSDWWRDWGWETWKLS